MTKKTKSSAPMLKELADGAKVLEKAFKPGRARKHAASKIDTKYHRMMIGTVHHSFAITLVIDFDEAGRVLGVETIHS